VSRFCSLPLACILNSLVRVSRRAYIKRTTEAGYSCPNAICSFPSDGFMSFHSPGGVLFRFPSRYLFSIDLRSIIFLGSRLRPLRVRISANVTELRQLTKQAFISNQATLEIITITAIWDACSLVHSLGKPASGYLSSITPVRSPLIRSSQLITFPLLTDMLKFSRYLL